MGLGAIELKLALKQDRNDNEYMIGPIGARIPVRIRFSEVAFIIFYPEEADPEDPEGKVRGSMLIRASPAGRQNNPLQIRIAGMDGQGQINIPLYQKKDQHGDDYLLGSWDMPAEFDLSEVTFLVFYPKEGVDDRGYPHPGSLTIRFPAPVSQQDDR